jgi:spore maturation protein CgeB
MRILITSPAPMYSTFDVFAGYAKALRALGHDVTTFDYHKVARFYNICLSAWNQQDDKVEMPTTASRVLAAEQVVVSAVSAVPDVVLIVTALSLHRRAFHLLDKLCLPTALLLTESPYEDDLQAKVMSKGSIDLAFTNERTSAQRLAAETGVETVYLPHAYDQDRHYPRDVGAGYKTDVFFHGTLWPKRRELMSSLKDLPCRVKVGGIWPCTDGEYNEEHGPDEIIDNEDMARWYSGTRVALNHHRQFCTTNDDGEQYLANGDAESLGPRAYEIAACGAFQLCDDTRAELGDVFGDTVATYSDADDLRAQVEYYLANDTERRDMAQAARQRVTGCTFEARAESVLVPALKTIASRR